MSKAQLVAERLDAFGERYGTAARSESATKRRATKLDPHIVHDVTTEVGIGQARNYMAEYGNYSLSMSDCDVVGINGGCGKTCPAFIAGQCGERAEVESW